MLMQLWKPSTQTLEGFGFGEVVDNDCSLGTPIVRVRQGSEPLLTSSVPNLGFHDFVLDVERFGGKLHPDSGSAIDNEGIIDEAVEDVGFTDARIANDDNLKQVIKISWSHSEIIILS